MRRVLRMVLVLALAAGAAGGLTPALVRAQSAPRSPDHGVHGPLSLAQPAAAVRIVDFQFMPNSVTVSVGGTVTWTHAGNAPHTVTSDRAGVFDSGRLANGQTFSFKFDAPGTFAFHCEIHPSMTGSVTVQAAAQATPTPAPAATATPTRTATPAAAAASPTRTATPAAGPAAAGATAAARIVDFAFEPGTLTVAAGTTVTWTHAGNAPHTITSDTNLFNSFRLAPGETFAFRFDTPGTFTYKCEIHPARMTGTVTVQAPAGAPTGEQRGATGTGTFGNGQATNDQFRLEIQNLRPQAGATITGWLLSDGDAVRLGALNPDGSGRAALTFTDPQGRNLLALFDKVVVTAETGAVGARPAGQELLRDEVNPGGMVHIRHLLASFNDTPNRTALAIGLERQAALAAEHARLAKQALDANDFVALRQRLEQIVNIIEGERGPNFGDLNGDERRDNPGDGFGLLNYATLAGQHAQLAIEAAPRDETIKLHGGHVTVASKNVTDWATEARDLAVQAVKAPNLGAARQPVERILALLVPALEGRDANNDGRIDPVPGEGGARTAFSHAQLMATLTPSAARVVAAPAASPTAAPPAAAAVTPAPDTTAPSPAGTSESGAGRLILIAVLATIVVVGVLGIGAWLFTSMRAGSGGAPPEG
jgi:plastocyanin